MPTNAGALVVSLGLDATQFIAGLTKSQYEAQKALSSIQSTVSGTAHALEGIGALVGVGFGVSEIVEWSKKVTEAGESLSKLADITGSSVEELSRLENVAKLNGTSIETFQRSIERLAAGLNGSEELSTKTAKALQYLGVASKDPATALQEVANELNKYADGAGKAALARDLFGRSGPAFLAYLKELATNTSVAATVTAEQAKNARELAESFRLLEIHAHALADVFYNEFAPSLAHMAELMDLSIQKSGGLLAGLRNFASVAFSDNPSKQLTEISEKIAKIREQIANPPKGALFQFSTSTPQQELDRLLQQQSILRATQSGKDDPANYDRNDRLLHPAKPVLNYSGASAAGGAVDDPARKQLEGQLKALDAFIAREQDALKAREESLREIYSEGYLSVNDYFNKVQSARDDDIRATNSYYAQEIAAAQAYLAHEQSVGKASGIEDARNRLAAIQEKQIKFNQDAATAEERLSFQRSKDAREYQGELDELNAKMLDLAGNTAAAANIRFDAQNRLLTNKLTSSGDTNALSQVAAIRSQQEAQNNLNDSTKRYDDILTLVSIQQGYINLAQSTGSITETQALVKTSELNKQKLAILQQELAVQESIALATADPAAIVRMEQLKLSIAEVKTQTDLLADSFNKTFGDDFATLISDVVTGTKSAKDALNDLAKTLTKQLADFAAKDLASQLFGQGGALSGIGGFFSKIFGTSANAGAGAGIAALGTSSASAATAMSTLTIAAAQAAAALASVGATGTGSSAAGGLSGLLNLLGSEGGGEGVSGLIGLGGFASGTDYAPGGLAVVGEHGPELRYIPRGAQIIPNDVLRAKREERNITINQTVNVMPGANTQTARQAANLLRDVTLKSSRDR